MQRFFPLHLAALLLLVGVLLSACVRTNTTIQIHPADLVSFDMEFRMNRTFANQTGATPDTITQNAKERLPAAAQAIATFTPIEEPEWVGTHATTIPLPADRVREFVLYTRDGAKARVTLPLERYRVLDGIGSVADLRQAGVEAKVSVAFPGKVLATNGVVTGNTVTWDLLQIDGDPWAEAQVGMEWWLIILIAIAVIFGVILVIWGLARIFRHPRRNPRYHPDRP